jgi:hypothetical protein
MATIESLLQGAIDMHLHVGPDPLVARRVNALEAAQQARACGMRGIVYKSHDYPTIPLASIVSDLVPEVLVMGSLALDYEIGGLNVFAVEASARMGAKIIWMPTYSAVNCRANVARMLNVKFRGEGIDLVKDNVSEKLDLIFEVIREYDMVLGTGHISRAEIFFLVEMARRAGIKKIVVTHASSKKGMNDYLRLEDQVRLSKEGAFIEHSFIALMPLGDALPPAKMVEAIRKVGAEHCIMSTDLGQNFHPPPAEGMRMFIATMKQCGLKDEEIEVMTKTNPAVLLGIP